MKRRGLIFWVLHLRSFRCWHCRRDVIWRESAGRPLVCRWCHRPTFGLAAAAARVSRVADDFARQLEEFGKVSSVASDRIDALVWSLYALRGSRQVPPPDLTSVDDQPEQV